MPYRNILWVKLEKRLLNDSRFFLMSEKSQLIYVKLLLIAAETENKIPKNVSILKELLRTKLQNSDISRSLKEIKRKFPKFKKSKTNYYFEEWDNRVNRIDKSGSPKEVPGSSKGVPKEVPDKEQDKDKDKEQDGFSFLEKYKKGDKSFKPFYKGSPMRWVEVKKKLFVIKNDEWLEFADKEATIEWRPAK